MLSVRIIGCAAAAIVVASLAQPGFAGSAESAQERSGSDSTRSTETSSATSGSAGDASSSTSESGTFRFTPTSSGGDVRTGYLSPQLRTYVPRVNRLRPVRDSRERFPQPRDPHERPIVWLDKSEETSTPLDADNPRPSGELNSLLDRNEVLVDRPTAGKKEDGNRIVFCNRKLLEMHISRDCEMLGEITPSPVPLKSAREARYAPCTVCYKPR